MTSFVTACLAASVLALGGCGLGRTDAPPPTIVVGGDVNHEAVHAFQRARGRNPTREDLMAIHRTWIDNEILFREGSKLAGSVGDRSSREELIARALRALDEKLTPSSVTDEELVRWFEARREKYEQPARYDLEDAALPGKRSESSVRDLVAELNGGTTTPASVRAFAARPESNLVQSFGPEATAALVASAPGKWTAVPTRDGFRAMRVISVQPATRAAFDAQRETIRRDWTLATLGERRTKAVQALWQNYRIEFAEAFECHADK